MATATDNWALNLPEIGRVDKKIRRRLLSLKNAALYMDTSQDTLRTLVHNGKLPVIRHTPLRGAKLWFDVRDLDAYIDSHKETFSDTGDWYENE